MKRINSSLPATAVHFLFLLVFSFLLSVETLQAQSEIPVKGYGGAAYNGLPENQFLTRWMILGPLPVSSKPGLSPDRETLKKAFDDDMLTTVAVSKKKSIPPVEHAGTKFSWKYIESKSDTVQLNKILGDTNYVVVYALAEITMSEPATILIGLGSDDGVRMWLNGKEV
ncbi:MAG: hypothetical protein H6Q21_549, partial [Bacteroidetes bacterium]|nr:hypothetical protein [Bacteroidota bacterium]